MGNDTRIEWAHHTYNPWIGCTRISPACDHCYAADWDKRYYAGEHWGAGAPRKRTSAPTRHAPYRWARNARESGERPRVFCCSLADVFDNEVPAEWRDELWQVIRETPELDWLLLTKRIGNVGHMLPEDWGEGWPHVWLGITVVTQAEVERDVPKLLDTPAAVRWLSIEPLLESVDLLWIDLGGLYFLNALTGDTHILHDGLYFLNALTGDTHILHDGGMPSAPERPSIDWIVVGGESGHHARPMHPDWVRELRQQCVAFGVPFFFKQWGAYVPDSDDHAPPDSLPDPAEIQPQHGATIFPDGRVTWRAGEDRVIDRSYTVLRVGKKAAGRKLDGRTHDGFPESAAERAEAERSYSAEDSR